MTHTLLTFLGRVDNAGHYEPARYHFPDSHVVATPLFGLALCEWLKADRLVILGTAGSMWDNLFEDCTAALDENAQMALMEAREHANFTQQQLDTLRPILEAHRGQQIDLRLISATLDEAGQNELLRTLAAAAEGSDRLSIDVTHGFRHLPMFALTAAIYLRALNPRLDIVGLWYGELGGKVDDGVKQAQVHDLSGLLKAVDWLAALHQHEWVGSYDGVSKLVGADNPALATQLKQAGFLESIHRSAQARPCLDSARKLLDEQPLNGAGALFQPLLDQRLRVKSYPIRYVPQRRAAIAALDRGDYLRAALFGHEAFVTKLTQESIGPVQVDDYDSRERARKEFEQSTPRGEEREAYFQLRNIRNVVAHGSTPERDATKHALRSPEKLEAELRKCINTLLPDDG